MKDCQTKCIALGQTLVKHDKTSEADAPKKMSMLELIRSPNVSITLCIYGYVMILAFSYTAIVSCVPSRAYLAKRQHFCAGRFILVKANLAYPPDACFLFHTGPSWRLWLLALAHITLYGAGRFGSIALAFDRFPLASGKVWHKMGHEIVRNCLPFFLCSVSCLQFAFEVQSQSSLLGHCTNCNSTRLWSCHVLHSHSIGAQ